MLHRDYIPPELRGSISLSRLDVNERDYDYVFCSDGQRVQCVKARDGEIGEYGPKALYRLLAGMDTSIEVAEGARKCIAVLW